MSFYLFSTFPVLRMHQKYDVYHVGVQTQRIKQKNWFMQTVGNIISEATSISNKLKVTTERTYI